MDAHNKNLDPIVKMKDSLYQEANKCFVNAWATDGDENTKKVVEKCIDDHFYARED